MKVVTLAAYLGRTGRSEPAPAGLAPLPMETREDEIAAARRQGAEEARAAAQQDYEAMLAGERNGFETRLAEARQAWAAEQGERLAQMMSEGLVRIETEIADAAARLLEPLLAAHAREAAIAELKAALDEIMADEPTASVRIEGPEDLLAILRGKLAERRNIAYVSAALSDITVEADGTLIETRLEAWGRRLKEAMA